MVNHDKVQEKRKALLEKWEVADNLECDNAVHALANSSTGRRYLWKLLQWGRVGTQPFNESPHLTAFSCGELNVGQQILAHLIEVDPAGYLSILKERADEQRSRDLDYARLGDPDYTGEPDDNADNSGDGDAPSEPVTYL